MRAGTVGIARDCIYGGRFQKSDNGKSSKHGGAKKGGGLPAGKPLNIRDQLLEIAPTESIRDSVDLVSGKADVLGCLRHVALIEFTCCPADGTRHAASKISTGGLLLFD
jgi:hypothetical protein